MLQTITEQSPFGTAFSTVVQAPSIEYDENVDPNEPTDWLHRNVNYERRCRSEDTFPSLPAICTKGASSSAS